jgi:hypothetical protein
MALPHALQLAVLPTSLLGCLHLQQNTSTSSTGFSHQHHCIIHSLNAQMFSYGK